MLPKSGLNQWKPGSNLEPAMYKPKPLQGQVWVQEGSGSALQDTKEESAGSTLDWTTNLGRFGPGHDGVLHRT
jgi:hypothetical protein